MFSSTRPATVLLVEDSELDIELIRQSFKKHKLHFNLEVARTGAQALNIIFGGEDKSFHSFPDLIFLDINLPDMNGIEILKLIKENEEATLIPVVILTSSSQDEDIINSYMNLADLYLQKPLNFASFINVVGKIDSFGLALVVRHPSIA